MGARRWPFISCACRQAPLATNPGGSSGNETGGLASAAPPLFGLAPGGVCRAVPVARTAVRSYRTLSPLPSEARALEGGLLSVALSLGSPPPEVIRHRASKEPGLSSLPADTLAMAERPSGLLTELIRGLSSFPSSWPRDQEGQALNAMSTMVRSSLRLAPPAACTDMP